MHIEKMEEKTRSGKGTTQQGSSNAHQLLPIPIGRRGELIAEFHEFKKKGMSCDYVLAARSGQGGVWAVLPWER